MAAGIQYAQLPVRLQLSLASNPPVPPIDANTGLQPAFWRGQAVQVDVGTFNAQGNGVDLTNLAQMNLVLMKTQLAPYSVVTSVVLASGIISGVTQEDWAQGVNQNATFNLDASYTDQALYGTNSADYWLAVVGITTTGASIIYGAGPVTLYNPGPIAIPTAGLVSLGESDISGSSTFQISPSSQIHIQKISVGDANPGISQGVLVANGLQAGSRQSLRFNLPSVAGAQVNIYDQSLLGSELFSVYSDPSGYSPTALWEVYFDGHNFQRLASIIPANGQQS